MHLVQACCWYSSTFFFGVYVWCTDFDYYAAAKRPPTGTSSQSSTTSSSSSSQPAVVTSSTPRMMTISSQHVLKWIRSYAALMSPLAGHKTELWHRTCKLFDNYLLACFILFSGVDLESFVWQDDLLPHRLKSALMRIMTTDGCKYKAQVCVQQSSRLQQTVPAYAAIQC